MHSNCPFNYVYTDRKQDDAENAHKNTEINNGIRLQKLDDRVCAVLLILDFTILVNLRFPTVILQNLFVHVSQLLICIVLSIWEFV